MEDRFIPYGRQWISDDDINEAKEVLRSAWLTQGPKIKEFEYAVAEYVGSRYAVAVSNGTAALHMAYLAAGLKSGDEIITTPMTFLATANAALYCGARPVFVDIDGKTANINPKFIPDRVKDRTRLIVPVHFGGNPCDMIKIHKIARTYDLKIVEDACHAFGAKYKLGNKWIKVGSCVHSDMVVFSFHPVKHITTCEGGMITTNSEDLYRKLLMLRNHGIVKDSEKFKNKKMAFTGAEANLWYYEMQDIGFNYRITDLQCAVGISQLKKADAFIRRRREIASMYNEAFKNIAGIKIPFEKKTSLSSYHLYALQIDFDRFKIGRNRLMEELKRQNIGTQVHYIPVHMQPYYREKMGYNSGDFPKAKYFYCRELSLPLYPKMSDKNISCVISALKKNLRVI